MANRLLVCAALSCLSASRASSMQLFSDSSAQRPSVATPCRADGLAFVGLSSLALSHSARECGAVCTGAHAGSGPLLGRLPIAHSRNARRHGALTTVCVFEQMTKGFGNLFGSQSKNDVDELKKILVRYFASTCVHFWSTLNSQHYLFKHGHIQS